jgi:ABC-type transport system involved in cytochrome bd biosynthesis fused ATPase/permease subunit
MKDFIVFLKCLAASAFIFYTFFIFYGIYKLDVKTMMPLIKIEFGFILIIVMLVIRHFLTKLEEKLMNFARQKQQ